MARVQGRMKFMPGELLGYSSGDPTGVGADVQRFIPEPLRSDIRVRHAFHLGVDTGSVVSDQPAARETDPPRRPTAIDNTSPWATTRSVGERRPLTLIVPLVPITWQDCGSPVSRVAREISSSLSPTATDSRAHHTCCDARVVRCSCRASWSGPTSDRPPLRPPSHVVTSRQPEAKYSSSAASTNSGMTKWPGRKAFHPTTPTVADLPKFGRR